MFPRQTAEQYGDVVALFRNERPLSGTAEMLNLNKVPGVIVTTGDARGGSFSFEMSCAASPTSRSA